MYKKCFGCELNYQTKMCSQRNVYKCKSCQFHFCEKCIDIDWSQYNSRESTEFKKENFKCFWCKKIEFEKNKSTQ